MMVIESDWRPRGRGFDCRPLHFHETTVDKLFTHVMPLQYNTIQYSTVQYADRNFNR